mmetsp:Transcript_37741/g.61162  ORF Transcript_37741/g.61162 Transcript_37741/m.61162 type:complete len:321 (-) Transcript_37741:261-1223(-)
MLLSVFAAFRLFLLQIQWLSVLRFDIHYTGLVVFSSCKSETTSSSIAIGSIAQACRDSNSTIIQYIEACLKHNPNAAREIDNYGELALHSAVTNSGYVASSIVELLLDAFPEAAASVDSSSLLPIHYACSSPSPVAGSVVKSLLARFPSGAALEKDPIDCLPLHIACRNRSGSADKIVQALLRVYPVAAHTADSQGCLPVHYAAQNIGRCARSMVRMLLETYIDGLYHEDLSSSTPYSILTKSEDPALVQLAVEATQLWHVRHWKPCAEVHKLCSDPFKRLVWFVIRAARHGGNSDFSALPHDVVIYILTLVGQKWPVVL